jgi:anti-anti-sigma regulatory factor
MLRITETSKDEKTVTLKLDGKMVGALVSDLEELCLHYRNEKGKTVVLDFSGVTFIDNKGLTMLRKIKDNRVIMVNYSLFIETLLDVNKLISSNSE